MVLQVVVGMGGSWTWSWNGWVDRSWAGRSWFIASRSLLRVVLLGVVNMFKVSGCKGGPYGCEGYEG